MAARCCSGLGPLLGHFYFARIGHLHFALTQVPPWGESALLDAAARPRLPPGDPPQADQIRISS